MTRTSTSTTGLSAIRIRPLSQRLGTQKPGENDDAGDAHNRGLLWSHPRQRGGEELSAVPHPDVTRPASRSVPVNAVPVAQPVTTRDGVTDASELDGRSPGSGRPDPREAAFLARQTLDQGLADGATDDAAGGRISSTKRAALVASTGPFTIRRTRPAGSMKTWVGGRRSDSDGRRPRPGRQRRRSRARSGGRTPEHRRCSSPGR